MLVDLDSRYSRYRKVVVCVGGFGSLLFRLLEGGCLCWWI